MNSFHTTSFGCFGVYHQHTVPTERAVLAVADEFREALCALYQQRHETHVQLRDRLCPELFAAMVEGAESPDHQAKTSRIPTFPGRVKPAFPSLLI